MVMDNKLQRVILFLTAIPILVALIFLPYFHHLAIACVMISVSGIGALEMAHILRISGLSVNMFYGFFLGISLPLIRYLIDSHGLPEILFPIIMVIEIVTAFAYPVFFAPNKEMKKRFLSIAGYMLLIFYPAFFVSYWTAFTAFPSPSFSIVLFMIAVQFNDSFAWLVGILFGKGSRNIIDVSPNKSLIGFIGGIFASIAVMVCGYLLFPEILNGEMWMWGVTGFFIGVAAIVGDLVESLLKRGAGVKDSGTIIMGRGGLLDSIDSLLFGAPVYFYAFQIIQNL